MRTCIKLVAVLIATQALAQAIPPSSPGDDRGVQVLTARVLRYNRAVMAATYEGDLIVRVDGSGQFAHLVYSPYDFGFDSPPADLSQLLPRSMTSDGSLVWTFTVHTPRDFREQGPCNAARADPGGQVPLDLQGFVPLPGAENVKLPSLTSLPCFVIQSWSAGQRPGPTPAHPEQAAR